MLGVRLRAQAATDGAEFMVSTTLATIRRMKPRGLIARPVTTLIPSGLMNRAGVVVVGSDPTQPQLNRMSKHNFLKSTSGRLIAFPGSSGYALGYSSNPALQAIGRMKPPPSPELSRYAMRRKHGNDR